jgi:hypothetical protein
MPISATTELIVFGTLSKFKSIIWRKPNIVIFKMPTMTNLKYPFHTIDFLIPWHFLINQLLLLLHLEVMKRATKKISWVRRKYERRTLLLNKKKVLRVANPSSASFVVYSTLN